MMSSTHFGRQLHNATTTLRRLEHPQKDVSSLISLPENTDIESHWRARDETITSPAVDVLGDHERLGEEYDRNVHPEEYKRR